MDFDPMSIEPCVCVGAGRRNRIDVGTDYETRTPRSRNPCEQPRTGAYIQYRFRLSLPAEQVDSRGAQPCGWMRSIPEHDRMTRDGRE